MLCASTVPKAHNYPAKGR